MYTARGSAPALFSIGSMSSTRLSLSMVASLQSRFCFTWRGHCSRVRRMCKRRYCRPPELPLVTGFLELAVARSVDLGLSPNEHIVRRHIADGAMQAYGVVVSHVGLNQAQRSFPRQRCAGSAALRLQRFVRALE